MVPKGNFFINIFITCNSLLLSFYVRWHFNSLLSRSEKSINKLHTTNNNQFYSSHRIVHIVVKLLCTVFKYSNVELLSITIYKYVSLPTGAVSQLLCAQISLLILLSALQYQTQYTNSRTWPFLKSQYSPCISEGLVKTTKNTLQTLYFLVTWEVP